MSNNQGDKPTITEGEWNISNTPEYHNPKCSTIEITAGNYWICKVQNNGLIGKKEGCANAKMIALAGNLSQKYGSLEQLESRMIEAEKLVKELENLAKEVKFVLGNYPDGTIGKNLSAKAEQLLTPKQ